MALRTDLERSERKQAIENCDEIIRNFRDNPNAANGKNQGLFAIVEEMEEPKNKKGGKKAAAKAKEEEEKKAANAFALSDSSDMEEDNDLNMSEFMREGGLQADIDEQKK